MVSHHISFFLSLSHQRRPLKKKKRTSSLKSFSSPDSSYLPDECWESIFRFIINDDDKNLNSLSLVSKQFLSITDRLRFSFTVLDKRIPFLHLIFKRFTNLTSLKLNVEYFWPDKADHLDEVLCKISSFPSLKFTSLDISNHYSFPANGLRAFSQNITTLTSLSCSGLNLYYDDLLLIADCFPLLKVLDLGNPIIVENHTDFMNGMHVLLSKCQCIQHLDLSDTYFLDDHHVAGLSLLLPDLVSINLGVCGRLTESALFSLVRNCPSLSYINMERTSILFGAYNSLVEFGVYPQLEFLYLGCSSDEFPEENIREIVSHFPNLQPL